MEMMRGQGATEYLVLLAVVLIVALVSVALLGFFPGMAADARITQSQSYWRGQARPFAINEYSINSTAGVFVLQNVEANGPYTVTNLTVGGSSNFTCSPSCVFSAGETKTLTITSGSIGSYSAGMVYDLQVNITYTTPNNIAGVKEYGTKNLVGKFV